jgi:D-alanyl-D-alanine carboxypeptidase
MYKNSIKENAIKLRKEGNSYSFISAKLSIAKSTLSNWLKNIEFMPNDLFNKNAFTNVKVEGKAYIVYDITTGDVIASKNQSSKNLISFQLRSIKK